MKVAIIEDETAAAVNLSAILAKVCPEAEIMATLESVAETVEWLSSHPAPDLLFMDIHLADGEAFRIFERIDVPCPIIFTTAYDQYALDAFKVNSIDYLLKPIKESDLVRALDKLRKLTAADVDLYRSRIQDMVHNEERQRVFLIPVRDKIVPLHTDQIAYCYTSNEKVTACTFEGNHLQLDKSLDKLSKMLPSDRFFRANRQFIIARSAVRDITVWFGSRLSLNLCVNIPERIIISKDRVPEFKRWFTGVQPAD